MQVSESTVVSASLPSSELSLRKEQSSRPLEGEQSEGARLEAGGRHHRDQCISPSPSVVRLQLQMFSSL